MAKNEVKEPNVGLRIRALREQRGLSLRALAERCDISINAISRIERGEASPTVSSLHQLAIALQVPITDFFHEQTQQTAVFIKSDSRLIYRRNGLTIESLGIGLRHQKLEPFLITVEPGTGNIDDPVSHPGQEFVHCLEGEIDYYVNDQVYKLEKGDSLLFEAPQPHGFLNRSDKPAQIIIVFQSAEGSHVARQIHLDNS
jgi:transcriptional regulator with XRE-family HTH domain